MRIMFWGLALLVVAGLAYVRLAPSDPERWHVEIDASSGRDEAGGAVRVQRGEAALLERADAYMRQLPRTHVLAGSVAEGRITYVTRSLVFGFPDYTTVEYAEDEGLLKAYGRLRFGRSDMGVNRARLEGLIDALQ